MSFVQGQVVALLGPGCECGVLGARLWLTVSACQRAAFSTLGSSIES